MIYNYKTNRSLNRILNSLLKKMSVIKSTMVFYVTVCLLQVRATGLCSTWYL